MVYTGNSYNLCTEIYAHDGIVLYQLCNKRIIFNLYECVLRFQFNTVHVPLYTMNLDSIHNHLWIGMEQDSNNFVPCTCKWGKTLMVDINVCIWNLIECNENIYLI